MKNVSNINSDEFGIELEKCIPKSVASNKLGGMFLKLADNAVHSKALGSFNNDVINEARGFLIEFIMEKFILGKKADEQSKHLAYYFTLCSNYLRSFSARRLGSSAKKDLLGGNIATHTKNDNRFLTPVRFIEWDKYLDFYEPSGLTK